MLRAGHILLISMLLVSVGVPAALLQSVAWLGMSVSYSLDTGSVAKGLEMTFDGEHPCRLCRALSKGEETGRQQPKQDILKKKVQLFVERVVSQALVPPLSGDFPRPIHSVGFDRSEPPPRRPPRSC